LSICPVWKGKVETEGGGKVREGGRGRKGREVEGGKGERRRRGKEGTFHYLFFAN